MSVCVIEGCALAMLPTLAAGSVQTCVTSPPYWGLRDYGTAKWEGGDAACDHKNPKYGNPNATTRGGLAAAAARADGKPRNAENRADQNGGVMFAAYRDICGKCGAVRVDSQLGLEKTPDEYVANMVNVFREVRRVLRDDGTLWLNLGDSYAGGGERTTGRNDAATLPKPKGGNANDGGGRTSLTLSHGLKPKDLVGIPWRTAFALQADGWYLRSDIIWHKPNPMPESVTDRPTKAHEYVFLLTKSATYYYDADAVREPNEMSSWTARGDMAGTTKKGMHITPPKGGAHIDRQDAGTMQGASYNPLGRNRRSVWTVATQPYSGAHFATFPPALIEPCILAGSAKQACEHCGAAWGRVTGNEGADMAARYARGEPARHGTAGAAASKASNVGGYSGARSTLGFAPSCSCADNQGTARSVVLDPFGGAGTTGLVADRLGRNAILVELNPEYAKIARERIGNDNPLFTDVA